MSFDICEELLEQYRNLRFNSNAKYGWSIIPLGSIYWPDEHPADGRPIIKCHETCSTSILRLLVARMWYWENGEIAPDLQTLWDGARELIPDWPGFNRLHLDEDQRRAHEQLQSDADAVEEFFAEDSAEVSIEDKGGGVSKWTVTLKAEDD